MDLRIGLRTVVQLSARQASCDVRGEVVILNVEAGAYFGLEEVGARIWQLLVEPRTVLEIRDTIAKEYDVTPDQCERDLLEFLTSLADNGLIECDLNSAPKANATDTR